MSYFHLGADADADGPTLTIRAIDAGVLGGTCYALCDGNGRTLPMQTECHIDNPQYGEMGSVTAKFLIDGKDIQIQRA